METKVDDWMRRQPPKPSVVPPTKLAWEMMIEGQCTSTKEKAPFPIALPFAIEQSPGYCTTWVRVKVVVGRRTPFTTRGLSVIASKTGYLSHRMIAARNTKQTDPIDKNLREVSLVDNDDRKMHQLLVK